MLANIFRKLNAERRIILQRFQIDKKTFSTIPDTQVQLYWRHASNFFKLTGKQSNSVSSISKNILRHSTNLAIENKELFAKTPLPRTYLQTQLPDEEVEKLSKLDWTSLSSKEFVSNFEKLTLYIYNLDKKPDINYDNFLQALSALSPHFYDEEIAHILKHLIPWFRNENHSKDVLKYIQETLDNECCNRFQKQNIESMLMFSHLFVYLRYGRVSNYTRKTVLKLNRKAKRLSPSQLAQFMTLMSVCRNLPVNLYEMEYYVEKNMETLSVQDLSKISIGFYRNKTQIKSSKLLIFILETMLNNMEIMTTHMVSAFSNLLRLSYKPAHKIDNLLRQVLKSLEPHVPRFTLITTTHISHLAAHTFIYEKDLMSTICERFDQEIKYARVKDIERITLSLTQFNYDSNYPLYKKIIEEIGSPHRQQEIDDHRKALPCIVKYLALVNIYPIKLLEQVMNPEFIDKAYCNKYAMNEDYFFLDQCIAAEMTNYTGPRLSDDLREFLAKRHKAILNPEMRNQQLSKTMKEVITTCQKILKTESGVFTDKILPQFTSQDIIICLDEQNNLIPPEPILSVMNPDSVKPVPEEAKKYKWIAIIVTMRNMMLKDSHVFSGIFASKYRQLKSLGYSPVVVSHQKWYDMKFHEDCEKLQEDYVKSLLNIE